MSKTYSVTPDIFELYPDFHLFLIHVTDMDNTKNHPEVGEILFKAEQSLTLPSSISEDPRIACWREAYKAFGAKAKKYPSSVEALCKRIMKGDSLPRINTLVDLYNAVCLEHVIPLGAEDLDKIEGNIELKRSDGSDVGQVLGQEAPEHCEVGEVLHGDEKGPICRRLNWREDMRTCIDENTKNCVVVIECVNPEFLEASQVALDQVDQYIQKYGQATTQQFVVNKSNPIAQFS